MSEKIDHFVAVAEHDFDSENNDELSFRRSRNNKKLLLHLKV